MATGSWNMACAHHTPLEAGCNGTVGPPPALTFHASSYVSARHSPPPAPGGGAPPGITKAASSLWSEKGCLLSSLKAPARNRPWLLPQRLLTPGWRQHGDHSQEYIRAGNMGSFLSCAVSTSILSGPLGHSTATRSGKTKTLLAG